MGSKMLDTNNIIRDATINRLQVSKIIDYWNNRTTFRNCVITQRINDKSRFITSDNGNETYWNLETFFFSLWC